MSGPNSGSLQATADILCQSYGLGLSLAAAFILGVAHNWIGSFVDGYPKWRLKPFTRDVWDASAQTSICCVLASLSRIQELLPVKIAERALGESRGLWFGDLAAYSVELPISIAAFVLALQCVALVLRARLARAMACRPLAKRWNAVLKTVEFAEGGGPWDTRYPARAASLQRMSRWLSRFQVKLAVVVWLL